MPYLVSKYLRVLLQGKGIEMSETLPDLLSIEKVRSGRDRNCMVTVFCSDHMSAKQRHDDAWDAACWRPPGCTHAKAMHLRCAAGEWQLQTQQAGRHPASRSAARAFQVGMCC
jgi:hypothetical protein